MHMVADEEISAEKVAAPAQTTPHEVTTLLQALLLRVYPQRGRVVELKAALAE